MLIHSLNKFSAEFNRKLLGAYRQITAEDIKDMTDCGLIGRHGYYLRDDLETVRTVLRYEQLRHNRERRNEIKDSDGDIHCKRCNVVLAAQPDGRRGRPNEYCPDCESSRSRERNRKWQERQRAVRE